MQGVAQETVKNKPSYVILVNDKIVTQAEVLTYGEDGWIKAMHKGVSEEEHARLVKKLGDKIGDREFVMVVEIFSEKERAERLAAPTIKSAPQPKKVQHKLNVDEHAVDFTVAMLDGTTVNLSDYKGKVVLLNFWATWCGPCIMEFYDMPETILTPFAGTDFVFLPIAIGEPKSKVQAKVQKMAKDGVHITSAIDFERAVWELYGVQSIPLNYLIDKKGVIRKVAVGNSKGNVEAFAEMIEKLLTED